MPSLGQLLRLPASRFRTPRRQILVVSVAIAGGYLAGLLSRGPSDVTEVVYVPTPVGVGGVVTLDPTRADLGYVSIGVIAGNTVKLVAKDGQTAHTWTLGHALAGMATMRPDGSLMYLGNLPPPQGRPQPPPIAGRAGIIERVAWDGAMAWSFEDALVTHDFAELPDGTVAVLRMQSGAQVHSRSSSGRRARHGT